MNKRISKTLLIMIVSFGLLACATGTTFEKKLQQEGAKRMNAEQVTVHLAGKTQKWNNGGAYFNSDGTVLVKFGGKVYPKRTWTVDDDGKVCILLPNGYVTSCSAYFDRDGKVWVVNLEIFGEVQQTEGGLDTVLEGNQLSKI